MILLLTLLLMLLLLPLVLMALSVRLLCFQEMGMEIPEEVEMEIRTGGQHGLPPIVKKPSLKMPS